MQPRQYEAHLLDLDNGDAARGPPDSSGHFSEVVGGLMSVDTVAQSVPGMKT